MGKATIQAIERDGRKAKITFKYDAKDEPWSINDFSGKNKLIKVGDRVDIKCEKNQKGFWQITDLQVIHDRPEGTSASNATPTSQAPSVGRQYYPEDPNKQKTIQRSVALKASVDLIVGMMQSGYVKKTATIDLINGLIQDQCAEWEQYLTLQKDYELPQEQTREPGEEG